MTVRMRVVCELMDEEGNIKSAFFDDGAVSDEEKARKFLKNLSLSTYTLYDKYLARKEE